MSRRLIVRPEAEAEMTEAFDWYEDRLPGLGAVFLLCVDAAFNAILRNPQHNPHPPVAAHGGWWATFGGAGRPETGKRRLQRAG